MRWVLLLAFALVFAFYYSIQDRLPKGDPHAAWKIAEADEEAELDEPTSSITGKSSSRSWDAAPIGHDPSYAPARALVVAVSGKELTVRPGTAGGLTEGLVLNVYRGCQPKSGPQVIGSVRVVSVSEEVAQLEVMTGKVRVSDFVVSAEIPLNTAITLPRATHRTRPAAPVVNTSSVVVGLKALVASPQREVASFGVPFPPGALADDSRISVWADGREIAAATRVLAPWRWDGFRETARSVLVQCELDFSSKRNQQVEVRWDQPPRVSRRKLIPVTSLLVKHTQPTTIREQPALADYEEPRVLATLPAKWLCQSWIVGPQTTVADNAVLPEYDREMLGSYFGEEGALAQMQANLSGDYAEHQLDRTVLLYRMFARTGEERLALDAYRHATFYRNQIAPGSLSKRGRGAFLLKHSREDLETGWLDVKYAYAEGPATHYLLTGDDRFKSTLADLCAFWKGEFGSFIQNDYSKRADGWNERFCAFAWLNWLHAYQILGGDESLELAREQCNNVYNMQFRPGDKYTADGSWRHSSEHHGEGGEALGSSVWMSALLVDAIFQHWLLTGDDRCPDMLTAYAEYTERYGMHWFSWADQTTSVDDTPRWAMPWYFASSTHGGMSDTGSESDHNLDTAYVFLMGYYFRHDPRYLYWGQELIRHSQGRMHPRKFNWCYRAGQQGSWLLQDAGVSRQEINAIARPDL